jgi:F-type H+-transporting ATPase subunit delta
MSEIQISQRYAKALFGLAQEQGKLEEVYASLQDLGNLLRQVETLREFIHNPLLVIEERHKALKAMFESKVPALVYQFLIYISAKNRLDLLGQMIIAFDGLYLKSHNRIRAVIETALPLYQKEKENILRQLGQKYGKEILADWYIKKDLLGGFKIFIEGKLHDSSFTSQLEEYKQMVLK